MNKEQADSYLKSLVSAYVWIASSDNGVDGLEFHKYENAIIESQYASQFNVEDIRRYFKDMVAAFSDDYDAGIQLTKARLTDLRGQIHLAEEVIRICRAAIVGDGKIEDPEELVLTEIAKAVGIKHDAL
ncbi:MAG: TerB family tellurite resistance protein [Bdellovibrionales bacterium]